MAKMFEMLLVDDYPVVREGLAMAVRAFVANVRIAMAGSIAQAERVAGTSAHLDMIVLDLTLPDSTGLSGLMRFRHLVPDAQVVMLAPDTPPKLVSAARMLGASGFLSKCESVDTLARDLVRIRDGDAIFPCHDEGADLVGDLKERIESLSAAQLRVLLAVAQGKSNKEIAQAFDLQLPTVKAHVSAGMRKLGVGNRTQALLAVQPLLTGDGLGSSATACSPA